MLTLNTLLVISEIFISFIFKPAQKKNIKNINAFKQRGHIEHVLEDIPFWIQSFPCMRNCLPLNTVEQLKFQLIAQAFLQLQHSSWNNDTQAGKSGLLSANKSLIKKFIQSYLKQVLASYIHRFWAPLSPNKDFNKTFGNILWKLSQKPSKVAQCST